MLMACKHCGRKFNPDRVGRHESACRNIKQKRKNSKLIYYIYNSSQKGKIFWGVWEKGRRWPALEIITSKTKAFEMETIALGVHKWT